MNFILIGICFFSGILIARFKALPGESYKAINAWIINIALPAVALIYIPEIDWKWELFLPFLMPLLVWTGSYFFIELLRKFIKMDRKTRAALFLTAGLGNTSFLGFPLTEAYYGEAGLKIAILCDQACFMVMAIFGIITATKAANRGKLQISPIIKKIIFFPPFLAFCLAFILPLFFPLEALDPLLEPLAITLIPLALFSVGLQLKVGSLKADSKIIGAALTYKLILAPLLVLIIFFGMGFTGFVAKVSIFEAGMAPMVTGTIIAADYNLNPKLANLILGIGIPISLVTSFLWFWILGI